MNACTCCLALAPAFICSGSVFELLKQTYVHIRNFLEPMCASQTPQNVRAQYKLLRQTCVHTKNPKRACRVLQHQRAFVPAHFAVFDEELVGDPAIFALDQTSSYK